VEKFEYKTFILNTTNKWGSVKLDSSEIDTALNVHGKSGYELVNIFPASKGFGESGQLVCIFKKRIGIL